MAEGAEQLFLQTCVVSTNAAGNSAGCVGTSVVYWASQEACVGGGGTGGREGGRGGGKRKEGVKEEGESGRRCICVC